MNLSLRINVTRMHNENIGRHVSMELRRNIPYRDKPSFFNIQQDFYHPADSLGKVLYFIDKDEQVFNQSVSFS